MNKHIKTVIQWVLLPGCILAIMITAGFREEQRAQSGSAKWFPYYDLDGSRFTNPPLGYAPLARWWWPGNDVNPDELRREINVLADNAFGGVEIQPFGINVPMPSAEVRSRVLSWDTPAFYEHVKLTMEEARKRGLIVDMNNGSGWPAGGPFLDVEDGFLTLLHASVEVSGGTEISIPVPALENATDIPSKPVAVLAVRTVNKGETTETIHLDAHATIDLTPYVKNDSLHWLSPQGDWMILAFWSRPESKTGSMTASPGQGPVVNHFDSTKVYKNYEHLFGIRTGLEAYYGNPLRAVFNDSYEFTVNRHFSEDFISCFKAKRGYDITPWLPANMQRKYNYVDFRNPNASPDFSFGDEDWRIRHDYDLTLSELFGEHFIRASSRWMEQRGMLHRTQAYGMRLDRIGSAGRASIPETESMLGAEAILKLTSSGAHLYNRPVVSAEAAVFAERGYMTTPQKIRLAVDKLFAAGINQIVFHGVPYLYFNEETLPLGWYPFYMVYADFSAHLGEKTQFWKYQKEINEYITRVQYALRAGKPKTDVLIYFPFQGIELTDNPEEILTQGYMEGVEPPLRKDRRPSQANVIHQLINQLEAEGITWEWINDESIQAARLDKNGRIHIRGNSYQALILTGTDVISLPSAEKINALAQEGMHFAVIGKLPSGQASFLNWEVNDRLTKQAIEEAILQKNSHHLKNNEYSLEWIKSFGSPVRFDKPYTFIRQTERIMSNDSRIRFLWNKSGHWQTVSCVLDSIFRNAYWLDAETGMIFAAEDREQISWTLPPYGSVMLYADTGDAFGNGVSAESKASVRRSVKTADIQTWDLEVDTIRYKDIELFDWKTNDLLRYSSREGIYQSSFQIQEIDTGWAYVIDMGKVCFTAEVKINGRPAGRRIFQPYCLDITSFLRKGRNTIEIRVTPGQLNSLIGEAEKGNPLYKAFKGKKDRLMSAGLEGPVILYQDRRIVNN
ncbi:MAG: hypothetical protein LBS88_08180 [Tannerellaceae bacterium]|jgi:hypothetical protein|nr:hypothetical protein [Tannerellaceae bacterium]